MSEVTNEKKILTAVDLRKEVEAFKSELQTKSVEELKELEAEYIKKLDENDELVSTKTFELPKQGFKPAADAIKYFVNKQSVQWQNAGSMLTLYEFWNKPQKEISFPMLDYTLNMLGALQYVGALEWKKVVDIDTFIMPIKESYGEVRTNMYLLAEKHNAIMEAMKLVTPFVVEDADSGNTAVPE